MANDPATIRVPYIAYVPVWAALIALSSVFLRNDAAIAVAGLVLMPVAYVVTNQIAWFIRDTDKFQTSKVTIISSTWHQPEKPAASVSPSHERILCGQALLTGADTAMVIALAAASGGFKPSTTVDLTINFMRPIAKADAILDAKVMRLGKTLAFCTCEIREAGGSKPAAFSTGTYAILG